MSVDYDDLPLKENAALATLREIVRIYDERQRRRVPLACDALARTIEMGRDLVIDIDVARALARKGEPEGDDPPDCSFPNPSVGADGYTLCILQPGHLGDHFYGKP